MKYDLETLRVDLFGGVTAAVVALPVALAFGVASGMGAAAGLYGAIATGFFASMFGGTRSQISGPTAPMTVAMAVIVTSHASTLAEALTVVVLGGLLQVLLGVSRIGRFVAYTPHVVVSGFMSGIGIIVMLMQLLPLLGLPAVPGGALGALRALPEAVASVNVSALSIGILTLAVGALWPRQLSRYVPDPLVALLVGTLLGVLWLTDAPVIGEIPVGLPTLQWTTPEAAFLARALEPALILALLGSVDSLLISLVADIKDHEVVIFDFSGATYVDDSAAMVLDRLLDDAASARTEAIVMGLSGSVWRTRCTRSISSSRCRKGGGSIRLPKHGTLRRGCSIRPRRPRPGGALESACWRMVNNRSRRGPMQENSDVE